MGIPKFSQQEGGMQNAEISAKCKTCPWERAILPDAENFANLAKNGSQLQHRGNTEEHRGNTERNTPRNTEETPRKHRGNTEETPRKHRGTPRNTEEASESQKTQIRAFSTPKVTNNHPKSEFLSHRLFRRLFASWGFWDKKFV